MKNYFSLRALLLSVGVFCAGLAPPLKAAPLAIRARLTCFEGNVSIELVIQSRNKIKVDKGSLVTQDDSSFIVRNISASQLITITEITETDTLTSQFTVPVIDPLPITPPIVSSSAICAGSQPAALIALVGQDQTVDWYDSPTKGRMLAAGQLTYIPPKAGRYYAEARNQTLGCLGKSQRSEAVVTINRTLCPIVTIKRR
ncbi:immunoglobulin domain-containing protein [Arundinibacter roseus]|uniref:Ig-like domain-containing protein n=1 Tax=Arundinibacter roseus TaxID=2070510 RepID=A0A4V2XAL0_9BACT|nr:hypothetical protein [Arundinibacter roseus]TDB67965.1 hypothetical protein EZE20_03295 [Arundinibacter roseus]